jgi:NAD(P)H-hydrate epimerase
MARLTGLEVDAIQRDREATAVRFAREWHQVVVLKGAHTVIAAPDGQVTVDPHANPALATGGTGDVLAGVIAGLRAQGLTSFEAAVTGVFLQGEAAAWLHEDLGDAGLLASDLLPALPRVMAALKR